MMNLIDVQVGSVNNTNHPPNKIKKRMICILAIILLGAFNTARADDMLSQNTSPINGLDIPTQAKFEQSIIQKDNLIPLPPTDIITVPPTTEQVETITEVPVDIDPASTNIPSVPFKRISSGFGVRKHPLSGKIKSHKGIDIPFPMGTPIFSPANGIVIFAGWQNGYGNVIKINHGNGYETVIAHNMVNLVHTGDNVTISTTIAKVGASGAATGPHIHFEIRFNGDLLNPINFLRKVD